MFYWLQRINGVYSNYLLDVVKDKTYIEYLDEYDDM